MNNTYIDGTPMPDVESARADEAKFQPCGCRVDAQHLRWCVLRPSEPDMNAITAARPDRMK